MFNEDSIMEYTDFNNVENKIRTLRTRIYLLDYNIPVYNRKIWDVDDYLIYTYLNNIETGIENMGTSFMKPSGWQDTKTWASGMSFSYKDVNRWWNNLNLIENALNNL